RPIRVFAFVVESSKEFSDTPNRSTANASKRANVEENCLHVKMCASVASQLFGWLAGWLADWWTGGLADLVAVHRCLPPAA
ncbi:unnamed protein product, partial [Ceratitis capitata]